ncbi:FRG1-like family-domain-containing protein [Umbelopsis sp. PMI_123]|nr:FRG1-like family-domain-containing protein [Umbelopsis sp. PMI_123]
MAGDIPKKGKLTFKGDKEHKKKKKRKADSQDRDHEERSSAEGWVLCDQLDDLVGPLFITHPSDPPICLTVNDIEQLVPYPIPDLYEDGSPAPTITNQVFIGARVVGSSSSFTLKSSLGKYLSADKFGVVSVDREAVSMIEEWKPTFIEGGVGFQNAYDKFLMVDEIAGGGYKVRADAESIGFCETFRVYCQARFKRKIKMSKKEVIDATGIELDNMKKFQSWGGSRSQRTEQDLRELKRAKKEGNLSETLLDRRSKMKADRYCK